MKREIWISDKNITLFDRGIIYFPDGRIEEMISIPNKMSVKPSVWLGCPGNFFVPDYAIRWNYAKDVIYFQPSEEDKSVIFHNERCAPVYIDGYQVLFPGESCEITGDHQEKHQEFLRHYNILGFYRFKQTTDRSAREHIEKNGMLVSHYGLIGNKQNLRFVIFDSNSNGKSFEDSIEISKCRITRQSKSEIVLKKLMKSYTFTAWTTTNP